MFTMPKSPRNKRLQICTNFGILFLLGWKFQKRKRLVIILFGLEDLFIIPINRPLAFEEKDTQALRKNQRLHQEGASF
jgi:hypothetical protein